MDVTIRRVQEGDAKSIATVQVASWKSAYREAIPDALLDALSVEEHTGNWKTILENPDLPIFVVETEIGLGGFCSLAASRDEDSNSEEVVEITALYVHPDHWRMGYGTRLCEKALREARARDARDASCFGSTHRSGSG